MNSRWFVTVFLLCLPAFSRPLTSTGPVSGYALMLFRNPALLSLQRDFGCAFSYSYTSSDTVTLSVGLVQHGHNNAFSLGYQGERADRRHILVSGFSQRVDAFLTGATFYLVFEEELPEFSFDVGTAYIFSDRVSAGLKAARILVPDSTKKFYERSVHGFCGIHLSPEYRLYCDTELYCRVHSFAEKELTPGGTVELTKEYGNLPRLTLLAGAEIAYPPQGDVHSALMGGAGVSFRKKLFEAGMFAGVEYGLQHMPTRMYVEAVVLPFSGRDRTPPQIKITLPYTTFSPDGDGRRDQLFIGIWCDDQEQGSGIKQWLVLISKDVATPGAMVRMFSQKTVPPSSLQWDGRDEQGMLCERGDYFIQCLVIDKENNFAKSEWQRVTLR